MSRMDGMSVDLIAENIALLKTLFPEAVTEGKVDFEVLKALLGGEIEQRQEYYKFTWNGKEAARAYARTRSMGTLRPCVEESSGKDGTAGTFDSDNLNSVCDSRTGYCSYGGIHAGRISAGRKYSYFLKCLH